MKPLSLRIARTHDAPTLLDMMEDFNRIEEINWSRERVQIALTKLLADEALGIAGIFHAAMAPHGYFVLTWGYDLEWHGRDAFLTELYLAPTYRGKGQARVLLSGIEALAREHGARALHLMVRPENKPARRLYEGSGYTAPSRVFLTKDLA
jgi:GNAT superfamily N-acetyltransferase